MAWITAAWLTLSAFGLARADDPPKPDATTGDPASFLKDVAPILVRNCVGCHNTRKSEGKYDLTSFEGLMHGGQTKDNVEPGDPEASRLVELIRADGQPRMPYKQDPLPADQVAKIARWIKQGAKFDGGDSKQDWVALLHKVTPVVVPESYPVAVPITAVAFSPDGTGVASAGYHEVNLWNVGDGALARRLRGLPERVYDVAYSPDGRWLATAGGDPGQYGAARLWVAEPGGGGKPVRDLVESADSLFAVAFSPDSKLVAAGGADRAIRVWEVETGKLVATIEDHADWVLDLAFSPDSKRLASASRDKTSKVFDVVKRESLVTFPGHAEAVYAVTFAPDGKSVATGGSDNQVRIWRPEEEGKQTRTIGGFGGAVFRVIYHPDGKQLIACSADKTVRVFADGSQRLVLNGHADWVYAVALSADGKTLASGSWDGEVRLWDFADGKPVRTILAAPGLKPPGPQAAAK
jgi:dipeptidyl aminopeptidase/acylaminoacyl peptidase